LAMLMAAEASIGTADSTIPASSVKYADKLSTSTGDQPCPYSRRVSSA
jgi:hypothetical protein